MSVWDDSSTMFSANSVLLVIEGESREGDCFQLQIIQRCFGCTNVLPVDKESDVTELEQLRSSRPSLVIISGRYPEVFC